MKRHSVLDSDFCDFAAGYGTRAGIAGLRAGQLTRRLLQLKVIVSDARLGRLDEAYQLLSAVQSEAPDAVAEVVMSPAFGTWSASALRALRRSDKDLADVLTGQLGVFVAAAAVRAGTDLQVAVEPVGGGVFIPGLGRAEADGTRAIIAGSAGAYRIGAVRIPADPHRDAPGWSGLRRIAVGEGDLRLDVLLDDLDPWRDNHGLSAAGRRDGAEVDRWRRLLEDAWQILVQHHERYAQSIAAGMHTIVPLNAPSSGNAINATSLWAFGSVSMTLPSSALTLASSLLHEFQHAKLGALLDMYGLYADDGAHRLYAPWRDDPRPLGGVLQGVYAFMGVTDFWRVQRTVLTGGQARFADLEFARWRDQVWRTLELLERCDAFTAEGRDLLAGMRATQLSWQEDPVPAEAAEAAADAAADHWTGWRLRNVHLRPEDERALVDAWSHGADAPWPGDGRIVRRDVKARARNARLDLAVLRVNDPDGFAGTCVQPAKDSRYGPADTAYAHGEYLTARDAYLRQIADDPDDRGSWAGLALASRRTDPGTAALWTERPEVPYAVHRAVRHAGLPAPAVPRLSAWLAAAQAGAGSTQVGGGVG